MAEREQADIKVRTIEDNTGNPKSLKSSPQPCFILKMYYFKLVVIKSDNGYLK